MRNPVDKVPNQITAHNAGWRSQFRFAVHGLVSGVCEFYRSAGIAGFGEVDPIVKTTERES
jgi:hypothetical protein